MSRKLSQLKTYWDADDAYLIISFLDELSDLLWVTDEIIEQQRANQNPSNHDDRLLPLDID